MGAWGHLPFDDDATNDWAYDLDGTSDLSHVESGFDAIEAAGADYLEVDGACHALGACEVLARLLGHPGYTNAYTEKVDTWVAAHPIAPAPELLKRANSALNRILGDNSELRELWEETNEAAAWRAAIEDLRARLQT